MNYLQHFSGVARIVRLVVEQKWSERKKQKEGGQKPKSTTIFYHLIFEDLGRHGRR
jgi:hypothetical protein